MKVKKYYFISIYLVLFPLLMLINRISLMLYPLGIVFVLFLGFLINYKHSNLNLKNITPIILLFIFMLISSVWSISPQDSLKSALLMYISVFIFFFSYFIFNSDYKEKYLNTIIRYLPIATFLAFIYFYFKFGGVRVSKASMGDLNASKYSAFSNHMSSTVELIIPFLIYKLKRTNYNISYLIPTIFSIILIIATQSRTSFILMLLIFILSLLLFNINISKKISKTTLYGLLVIVAILTLGQSNIAKKIVAPIIERFENSQITSFSDVFKQTASSDEADYARALMYAEGINVIKKNSLMGIGFNSFKIHMDRKYGIPIISHNLFITAWGELGIIGLILALIIVYQTLKIPWQARKQAINDKDIEKIVLYSAVLISVFIAWMHFMTRPQFSNPIFWFVLAYAYSVKVQKN